MPPRKYPAEWLIKRTSVLSGTDREARNVAASTRQKPRLPASDPTHSPALRPTRNQPRHQHKAYTRNAPEKMAANRVNESGASDFSNIVPSPTNSTAQRA